MFKMKKTILFVALLTSLSIQAQNSTTWNISVGGSFPIGDFASFSYDPNTLVTNCGLMDEDANGGGVGRF